MAKRWIVLEKDGTQELFNNKFNFWFLLGLHVQLVVVLDCFFAKLWLRFSAYVLIYLTIYWVLVILSAGPVYITVMDLFLRNFLAFVIVPMGHSNMLRYPETISVLVVFHWMFMLWHIFTRKRAKLALKLDNGWRIIGSSPKRRKVKAVFDLMEQGIERAQ